MPDSIQPVGAMVNADPNQAFNSINNILGIKAKKLALQGQAADVQQKQQDASQRAAAADYFKNLDFSSHVGSDGTLNLAEITKDPKLDATGDAKPAIIQQLIAIKSGQLGNAAALSKLNQGVVENFGQSMNALKTDPDIVKDTPDGRAKLNAAVQSFAQQGPDNARIAQIYAPVLQHAPQGHLQGAVNSMGLQAQSVSAQQGQQNPQGELIDNGPSILPANRDVQSGALTAAGAPIQKGYAPQLTTAPNGQVAKVDSSGGLSVAPERTPGVNPTAPQMIGQRGQAEAVTGRVSQALNQANNTVQAQDALTRAKAILESPTSPKTGANFESVKSLKNLMSGLGVDTQGADDMNTLAKNLARFEAARATASGLGGTDAARELAHAGSPNTGLDNKAALAVVNQSLATEKALASYAKVQSKTNDPQALLKNESDFRNIPHLVEAHEYGMSRNAKEADEYLQRHGISHDQMKKSREAIKEFDNR